LSYVYQTSNPAEASLVESFFAQKDFSVRQNIVAAIYGMPSYEVIVDGVVDEQLQTDLRNWLNQQIESEPINEDADEELVLQPDKRFSVFTSLFYFGLAELFLNLGYPLIYRWSGSLFNGFGLKFFSYLVASLFLVIVCRKTYAKDIRSFFGIHPASIRAFITWGIVGVLWSLVRIGLLYWFPNYFPGVLGHKVTVPAIFLLVLNEFLFRGFLLQALEDSCSRTKAVLLSGVIFGFSHFSFPWTYQVLLVSLGILLGISRVSTKSIFVPIFTHVIGSLGLMLFLSH